MGFGDHNNWQQGSSLIAIMVGLAISAILGLVVSQNFVTRASATKTLDQRQDVEDIRLLIRNGFDCRQTERSLPKMCFKRKASVALRGARPGKPPLVKRKGAKDPTKVGRYFLRAKCRSAPNEYHVYFSTDQSEWRRLFDVPLSCPH